MINMKSARIGKQWMLFGGTDTNGFSKESRNLYTFNLDTSTWAIQSQLDSQLILPDTCAAFTEKIDVNGLQSSTPLWLVYGGKNGIDFSSQLISIYAPSSTAAAARGYSAFYALLGIFMPLLLILLIYALMRWRRERRIQEMVQYNENMNVNDKNLKQQVTPGTPLVRSVELDVHEGPEQATLNLRESPVKEKIGNVTIEKNIVSNIFASSSTQVEQAVRVEIMDAKGSEKSSSSENQKVSESSLNRSPVAREPILPQIPEISQSTPALSRPVAEESLQSLHSAVIPGTSDIPSMNNAKAPSNPSNGTDLNISQGSNVMKGNDTAVFFEPDLSLPGFLAVESSNIQISHTILESWSGIMAKATLIDQGFSTSVRETIAETKVFAVKIWRGRSY